MRAGDVIVGPQRQRHAHPDRLHADVRMRRAAHLARPVQRQREFVEVANGQHQPQGFADVESAGRLYVARLDFGGHIAQTLTVPNASLSAELASRMACLAASTTTAEVAKPCTMPGS